MVGGVGYGNGECEVVVGVNLFGVECDGGVGYVEVDGLGIGVVGVQVQGSVVVVGLGVVCFCQGGGFEVEQGGDDEGRFFGIEYENF